MSAGPAAAAPAEAACAAAAPADGQALNEAGAASTRVVVGGPAARSDAAAPAEAACAAAAPSDDEESDEIDAASTQVTVTAAFSGRVFERLTLGNDSVASYLRLLRPRINRDSGRDPHAAVRLLVAGSPHVVGGHEAEHLRHGTRDRRLYVQYILSVAPTDLPTCTVCGLPAFGAPYARCNFCGETDVMHHGRCCRRGPAWYGGGGGEKGGGKGRGRGKGKPGRGGSPPADE